MRERVDALVWSKPASAGGGDAEAEIVKVDIVVDIAVDRQACPPRNGCTDMMIAQIEALPVGIDFKGGVVLFGRGNKLVNRR